MLHHVQVVCIWVDDQAWFKRVSDQLFICFEFCWLLGILDGGILKSQPFIFRCVLAWVIFVHSILVWSILVESSLVCCILVLNVFERFLTELFTLRGIM